MTVDLSESCIGLVCLMATSLSLLNNQLCTHKITTHHPTIYPSPSILPTLCIKQHHHGRQLQEQSSHQHHRGWASTEWSFAMGILCCLEVQGSIGRSRAWNNVGCRWPQASLALQALQHAQLANGSQGWKEWSYAQRMHLHSQCHHCKEWLCSVGYRILWWREGQEWEAGGAGGFLLVLERCSGLLWTWSAKEVQGLSGPGQQRTRSRGWVVLLASKGWIGISTCRGPC